LREIHQTGGVLREKPAGKAGFSLRRPAVIKGF
jgi:hypothetical protein